MAKLLSRFPDVGQESGADAGVPPHGTNGLDRNRFGLVAAIRALDPDMPDRCEAVIVLPSVAQDGSGPVRRFG